jgi:hypothetical protein
MVTELDLSIFAYTLLAILLLSLRLSAKREDRLTKHYEVTNEFKIKLYQEESQVTSKLQKILDDYFKFKINDEESIVQFSHMIDDVSLIQFKSQFIDLEQYKKFISSKQITKDQTSLKNTSRLQVYISEFDALQKNTYSEILPPESFFSVPRKIDWDTLNKTRKHNGDLGEMFVCDLEKNYLTKVGRSDLAERVHHVASEGDGHGYDIQSFNKDGSKKFIEVKATNSSTGSSFNISKNEFNFLQNNLSSAVVYHVHNVNNERETTVVVYPAGEVLNSPSISLV